MSRHDHVAVIDMSQLRVSLDRTSRSVTVSCGHEPIAVMGLDQTPGVELDQDADLPMEQGRELLFRALDHTLAHGRATRQSPAGRNIRMPVALYNPHTGEVAVGPVPSTRAYTVRPQRPIPSQGAVCTMRDGELTWPDGRSAREQDRSFSQMTRARQAHIRGM